MSDQPDVPTEVHPDVRSLRVAAAIVAAYAARGRPHLVATANRVEGVAARIAAEQSTEHPEPEEQP